MIVYKPWIYWLRLLLLLKRSRKRIIDHKQIAYQQWNSNNSSRSTILVPTKGYLNKRRKGEKWEFTKKKKKSRIKTTRKDSDLNAEIALQRDIVGPVGQEITLLWLEVPTLHQDLALLFVEIGGERGEIELGEIGALQDGVHAVHGAQLALLYLVVQEPSIARSFHSCVYDQTRGTKPLTRREETGEGFRIFGVKERERR